MALIMLKFTLITLQNTDKTEGINVKHGTPEQI